ncbi:MAG TPA: aspartyl-phosphate phosphatase Spo0E family protein [Tissierellales bacterium]|nr:aspartyl-phosphate phosphatase Spo0E family protein [Tissierellales bacterium]
METYLSYMEQDKYIDYQRIMGKETSMSESRHLGKVKEKIERKRRILNQLITLDIDKEKILQFSRELDELILEYHKLELYDNGKKSR